MPVSASRGNFVLNAFSTSQQPVLALLLAVSAT
jgi:hypothetical protein